LLVGVRDDQAGIDRKTLATDEVGCKHASTTCSNTRRKISLSRNRSLRTRENAERSGILSSMPRSRAVGASAWRVVLPDARLTLVQIGIGIVDLVAGSLATYVLLPEAPSTDYAVVVVAYVIAALLSFLSHALGSLGVFAACRGAADARCT
jgi:uncharacterized membrane protein YbhN (UPF0104 family)